MYRRPGGWTLWTIRRSPTMNVVSYVIVFYVVFCVKKYMSSFQMCDRIADTGFVDTGYVFPHSPI